MEQNEKYISIKILLALELSFLCEETHNLSTFIYSDLPSPMNPKCEVLGDQ